MIKTTSSTSDTVLEVFGVDGCRGPLAGGTVFFPVADAFRVIRAWRDWTHGAPATMTSAVALLPRSGLPGAFHDEPATAVEAFAVDPAVLRGLEAHLQVGRTSISGGFPMAVQRHRPNDDQPTVGAGPNQSMLLARLDDWAIDALLRAAGAGSAISYELWRLGSFGIASRRQRPQARFLLRGLKVGGTTCSTAVLDVQIARCLAALAPWSASAD